MAVKIITALIVAIIVAASGTSYAGIKNSRHDFSTGSTGPSSNLIGTEEEICVFCHVPHKIQSDTKPLWNREDPAGSSFTMYGDTSNGTPTDTAPNPPSLRCLGCHDGATAVDAYGGATGTESMRISQTDFIIGNNLTEDHPVGVEYDSGGDFHSPTGATGEGIKLYDNKVECSSCHEPHDPQNGKFLRKNNTKSALCLTCHDK